jgi:hypothetical protein
MFHPEQFDDYEEELDDISYDTSESKFGFETNFDIRWYSIEDMLELAAKPEDLADIDESYDYYEMNLQGVYPTVPPVDTAVSKTGFGMNRDHLKYVYQDSSSIFDVFAAVGGMYTSISAIIALVLVKLFWGYDYSKYSSYAKWKGIAPYAPKKEKKDGEEEEDEGGDEDV